MSHDTVAVRGPVLRGRGVVLGGGGLSGFAWLGGVLSELPPMLSSADRVVGTSAGALLAARLLGGRDLADLGAHLDALAGVRLRPGAVAAMLAAQVWPSRRHALQWLGRRAARPTPITERDFLRLIEDVIGTDDWPPSLVVAAVDAGTGRPAYFTVRSEVPLGRAVAASCAMPGVFPPVRIEDHAYLDGGLRSPANVQLVTGCARVVVLAPQGRSARPVRRPAHQVEKLREDGAEVVLVQADLPGAQALSASALPAARELGRSQGRLAAPAVRELWAGHH